MIELNHFKLASLLTLSVAISGCLESDGSSSGKSTDTEVGDSTPPVITLQGGTAINILRGEEYSELGATAEDDVDGTVMVETTGTVNQGQIGTYTLSYTATDSSGNSSKKTRTITVLPSATLNIQSKNYFTGSVIEGASITISSTLNNDSTTRSGMTNSDGELSILVAEDADKVIVSGDAEGFAEFSKVTLPINQVVDIFLQPVNAEVAFTPSTESNLEVSGLSIVTIAANSLVDGNGNAAVGEVKAKLTVIDPSSNPNLMSGNFETVDSNTGQVINIESFGAVNVTFNDESGNRYNLAPGQTATVRIPLAADSRNPPQSLPLYYFDEETGYWVEDGTATLKTIDGEKVYEGTVSHFSTWSANNSYNSVQITGCIQDTDSNPVHLVEVLSQGITYSGQASTFTNIEGNFSISAKSNSTVLLSANTPNGLSRTTSINTSTLDIEQDECITLESSAAVVTLTWGQNPRDLDTQFFGPKAEGGDEAFLVYYRNKEEIINGSNMWLDVDDVSSFGPEITTISSFPHAGRYSYAVKHFSGTSDIAASPARVELNYSGQRQIFTAPEGEPTICWAVFDFVVDNQGDITIETVGAWKTDSYCRAREFNSNSEQGIRAMSTSQQPSNILERMIKQKYYAQ